jgi:hypothetical protein
MRKRIHQKTSDNATERREGGILLMVLVVMLILTSLGMGMMSLERVDSIETSERFNRARAFWMAEAGLNELKAIITHEDNRRSPAVYGLVGEDAPVLTGTFDGYGSYKVYVREATTDEKREGVDFVAEVLGQSEGRTDPVHVFSYLRLTTVSELVWATDDEGDVYFGNGDDVWGPIKSNGEFNISGTPKIYGYAETSASTVNYNDSRSSTWVDAEVFLAGLTFDVAETDFDPNLITDMAAASGMDTIEGDCEIEFEDELFVVSYDVWTTNTTTEMVEQSGYWVRYDRWGNIQNISYSEPRNTRNWTYISGGFEEQTNTTVESTTVSVTNYIADIGTSSSEDNIIYVNGVVEVSGTVGGSVSVVSSEYIKIVDDLVYSSTVGWDDDPSNWSAEPDDDELLGLYAAQKVEVDYDEQNYGEDVNVHAAIFVAEYDGYIDNPGFGMADRDTNLGSPDINLYGSIVQYERGTVAEYDYFGRSTGWGWGGFDKNYHHDARFTLSPPPGSPMGVPTFTNWRVAGL